MPGSGGWREGGKGRPSLPDPPSGVMLARDHPDSKESVPSGGPGDRELERGIECGVLGSSGFTYEIRSVYHFANEEGE